MIFTDAAFSKLDGKAGYDYAIWINGSFVVAGSLDGSKVSSSKESETRAILSAVIKAKAMGFSKVHILTDALEVVRGIKGKLDWSIDPILQDISMEASSFECFQVSYIPKTMNVVTHNSAKKTYKGDGVRMSSIS